MDKPSTFYIDQIEKHQLTVSRLYKKMTLLSTLRILVFLATIFAVHITFDKWQIAAILSVIGIVIFIYLLSKYTDLKAERQLKLALVDINATELEIASGKFHNREQGLQFQNPTHFYSLDIDLFGKGSFFQFINRTVIKEGKQQLAEALKANDIDGIQQRQEAIQELSLKP